MRGAALKLGQMLSIQDENVLPPQVRRARAQPRRRPSLTACVECPWMPVDGLLRAMGLAARPPAAPSPQPDSPGRAPADGLPR
jgi:hypothetical protein